MTRRQAKILLVEDSYSDQLAVERALEDGRIECDLHVAKNGREALKMLLKESPYENEFQMLPDLIMMDINMPVMNGKDALQKIRSEPSIRHLPVIMLTTSKRDKDVMESYRLGVNAYLTKPVDDEKFLEVIRHIETFWFELVVLPSNISS